MTRVKDVENLVIQKAFGVGVMHLEQVLVANEKIDIKIVGMLILDEDIDAEIANNTIQSLKVKGVIKANAEVSEVLNNK